MLSHTHTIMLEIFYQLKQWSQPHHNKQYTLGNRHTLCTTLMSVSSHPNRGLHIQMRHSQRKLGQHSCDELLFHCSSRERNRFPGFQCRAVMLKLEEKDTRACVGGHQIMSRVIYGCLVVTCLVCFYRAAAETIHRAQSHVWSTTAKWTCLTSVTPTVQQAADHPPISTD